MPVFFSDSEALKLYVEQNDVTTWHGGIGFGSLIFIDSPSMHVVFETRADYEIWDAAGRPVQFSLF